MSPVIPEGRGSLKFAVDRLGAIETEFHPTLNVYRWWRPDMALPAVWNWMTPGDVEAVGAPACRVDDVIRVTVSIGVDPGAVAGEGDMLELEEYADLAIPVLDAEVYGRNPFGQRLAKRTGLQTVADRLGDVAILALELPVEITLEKPITRN